MDYKVSDANLLDYWLMAMLLGNGLHAMTRCAISGRYTLPFSMLSRKQSTTQPLCTNSIILRQRLCILSGTDIQAPLQMVMKHKV